MKTLSLGCSAGDAVFRPGQLCSIAHPQRLLGSPEDGQFVYKYSLFSFRMELSCVCDVIFV